jgi:hypothetical protein
MIIPKIIFYLNILAWLLPPFRQKGCRYFLYFLILAVSDPLFTVIDYFHQTDSTFLYLVVSILILMVLFRKAYLSLLLIPVILLGIYLSNLEIRAFTFIVHFVILLYFLKEFILLISDKSRILIFNLILVLYEASIMFKFAATYLAIAGYLFFYITTAFEIFIAVFFTVYNEKSSPVINLRMEPRETE